MWRESRRKRARWSINLGCAWKSAHCTQTFGSRCIFLISLSLWPSSLFFPPLLPLKQPIRAWNIRPRLNVKVEIFPLFMLLWHVTVISSRHKVPGMAKHNTQKRSEAQSKGLDRRAEKTIQRFKHTVFLSHAPAWLLNPVERKNNNRGELWKWKVKMIHSCLWDLACLINENDKLDQELRWQKALWWYMFYIHVAGFAADFVLQHKDNIILQHWRWPDKSLFSIRSHCQWEQESGGACMSAWGNGVTLTLSSHRCGRKNVRVYPNNSQRKAAPWRPETLSAPRCLCLIINIAALRGFANYHSTDTQRYTRKRLQRGTRWLKGTISCPKCVGLVSKLP